jgi:hypothetical protein
MGKFKFCNNSFYISLFHWLRIAQNKDVQEEAAFCFRRKGL